MTAPAARLALRIVVGILAVIGVVGAVNRGMNVLSAVAVPAAMRPALQESDRFVVALTTFAMGVSRGTPEYQRTTTVLTAMMQKYEQQPTVTAMHMMPSILFMLLCPLQFSRVVRSRYRALHRWSGRFLLLMAASIAISAAYFGVVHPLASMAAWERPTIAIFVTLFVYVAIRGYVAIRRRDVARHREWMVRMFAMTLGISTVRLASLVLTFTLNGSVETLTGMSMWTGWLITMGAAELWIRSTRAGARLDARAIAPLPRTVVAT